MTLLKALVLCCVMVKVCGGKTKFPLGFQFGAATAAYQVEGAWNVSDKSASVWDVFTHNHPERIYDHGNGDIACDSYHQWQRDVEIAAELGLHFYRFSVSWSRIMPSGFPNHLSEDGTKYYDNLIDALLEKKIEPVITLNHYDLPQALQDYGGWLNPMISEWFAEYARVIFTLYGDRVKTWFTINEPLMFCQYAYNTGLLAPGTTSEVAAFLCGKHAMLAHAKAWRIYDKEFKPKYSGRVSMSNHLIRYEPATEADEETAELVNQLATGLFSHPIYSKEGGWPPAIESIIARLSAEEGYTSSKLPRFSEEEIQLIKGTYDFYGFSYYTARVTHKAAPAETVGLWPFAGAPALGAVISILPEWHTSNYWFSVYPSGMRKMLNWVKNNYGDIEIFIVENGYLSTEDDLDDPNRVLYYKQHLKQVLLAIYEDNVTISAYTAWSLMDNFEWGSGYSAKMGLYAVDFQDPNRRRTARSSARYYSEVISKHALVPVNQTTYLVRGQASEQRFSVILILLALCITTYFNS